ncbi:hypothetical protein [Vibrio paucivorans]|uniref:Uncharacterized protein n=1 Tax=Vibrio paucivorans TaxID=2829489 RepID=A0A9X3CFC4_9VIBR|nr:hypothetical protein [Vibrio paucivorans]MCW8334746.1 hypothetical protein [Vibrio paucivorans]
MKRTLIWVYMLGVISLSAGASSFDSNYKTKEFKQYVFETEAGWKYSVSSRSTDHFSVCTVSLNDGYGAFAFAVFPRKETDIDVIYEDYEGDDDYETAYRIECFQYEIADTLSMQSVKRWKESMGDMRSLLGESGGVQSGRNLEDKLNDDLSYEDVMDLEVDEQNVGNIIRLSNVNKDTLYVCAVDTSNTSDTLYLMLLPNTLQTFQIMAAKNGDWSANVKGCSTFSVDIGYTYQEIRERVNKQL